MTIRPIIQSQSAECGLACLAMLASAHGMHVDLADLRQKFSISLKGANLAQLMRHAQALGFACRPLRLELGDVPQLQVPCMLHWDLNHFVVLLKVSRGKLTLLDPATGRRVMSYEEAGKHFTGVALEVTPTTAFVKQDTRRRVQLRDLIGRVVGLKRALFNITLIAIGLECIAIVSPLLTQWVVDSALVTGDRDLLLLTVLAGAALAVVQFVLWMSRGWISLRVNQQVSIQFATNLFAHLLRLPLSFFERRHVGDITSRFSSLDAVRAVLTQSALSAVLDGVMAIVTLGMMVLYSPLLSAVAVIALGLYAVLRWLSFGAFRASNEENIVVAAKQSSFFLETVRAVQPLKLFNKCPERLARWQNLMVDVQNRELTTQTMELWFTAANVLIFTLEGVLILYLGGLAVLSQQMTLGMLLAFIAFGGQFAARTTTFLNLVLQIKMLALHAERLADIALELPEPDAVTEVDVARITPRLEVRNVSFRYADGEPWVLRNCSLVVESGEHVAICGPSGCGKSTLLKLMLGLLTPNEGDIRIGGIPLMQLGSSQYRRMIAAVMQNDTLLAGSLAENISCFDPEIDHERVERAASLAQIHTDISAMPMGYRTLVGDMGSALSGGQQQRVLLARALYADPKILALDEATSSLDEDNEQKVNTAVKGLPLTRVTIAHRRETIKHADRVVQLA